MEISLRGELTPPSNSPPSQPSIDKNVESIQGLLSQFVRLSSPAPQRPKIVRSASDSTDETLEDSIAPWSLTAREAALTEAALSPFLIHLAAARDDAESMKSCIAAATHMGFDSTTSSSPQHRNIAAGIVNSLEAGSGRSPLHMAALNGSTKCVHVLLKSGALVHLRDSLGHTALYYASTLLARSPSTFLTNETSQAARQRHEETVEVLVQAGANLSGLDLEGGFVNLAVKAACRNNDQAALRIWAKTGIRIRRQSLEDFDPEC
jgi:lysophospholipase